MRTGYGASMSRYRSDDRRRERDDDYEERRELRRPREYEVVKDEDVEEAIKYLSENADAAAKAIADLEYLEAYRQSLKAMLMKQSAESSAAAQERDAYAHPNYIAHLVAIRTAVENAERHKFLLAAKRAIISAWQTQKANHRVLGEFR